MTLCALQLCPHHQLFAAACAPSGVTRKRGVLRRKEMDRCTSPMVDAVFAYTNASVPGYRSNNRLRET